MSSCKTQSSNIKKRSVSDSVCLKHRHSSTAHHPSPPGVSGHFIPEGFGLSGGWEWDSEMTGMAVSPGGILLLSSNGPFRLLLAYLERCSGDRKGTSEFSLPPFQGWPRNEATCTKWWRVLSQDKRSCVLICPTLEGFSSKIWLGSGILWKCHVISPKNNQLQFAQV